MNKQEFLAQLRKGLSGLPQKEAEERLNFYSEMIDDRMEDGLSEEEAVAVAGSVDDIVFQTVSQIPLTKIAKERIKPKRQLATWEILLLVLGFPVWFPVGIAIAAVLFSVYVTLWSVIVSLWAVFASLAGCAIGGIVAGILFICTEHVFSGVALIAAGMICAGLSIFAFFGCKALTKGIVLLTKKFAVTVKSCFIKKEDA